MVRAGARAQAAPRGGDLGRIDLLAMEIRGARGSGAARVNGRRSGEDQIFEIGGGGQLDAIAAGGFGAIERGIGGLEEGFSIASVAVIAGRDAETHGEAEFSGGGVEFRGFDAGANSFGDADGAGGIGERRKDNEFLAAVAADGIVSAQESGEAHGDAAKNGVAGQVAVRVVDFLEVIHVGENEADGFAGALAAGDLALDLSENFAAIGDAGEGIVGGLELQGVAGGDEFVLKMEDALADEEAGLELFGVEGLGDVIVGARLETLKDILFLGAGAEKHDVGVGLVLALAELGADFHAFHAGHHPVEDGETRRSVGSEDAPGIIAAGNGSDAVTPASEKHFEDAAGNEIVFGDKDVGAIGSDFGVHAVFS